MTGFQHGRRYVLRDVLGILRLSNKDSRFNKNARICNIHFEHKPNCPVDRNYKDSVLVFSEDCTCGKIDCHLHPHDDPECTDFTIAQYVEARYEQETGKKKTFDEIKRSMTL